MFCLLAFTSLTSKSIAQNLCTGTTPCVTTWHNDNNRTGWQKNETTLCSTGTGCTQVNQNSFGYLWQWGPNINGVPMGRIYAQPLAVAGVSTNNPNCDPCDLVFIADEKDLLYAFSAESNSQTPVWGPIDLAGAVGGTYLNCSQYQNYGPCSNQYGGVFSGATVGVTGTPVIDTQASPPTLYAAATVGVSGSVYYYLIAVDITKGTVLGSIKIDGKVPGVAPSACGIAVPLPGDVVNFNSTSNNYIQRSALLLLNHNVYVAFAAGDHLELENGWLFGYQFTNGSFPSPTVFATTPYGTGGGIWQSGGGPASDGSFIYFATGNGSFYEGRPPGPPEPPINAGSTLLKLAPSSLTVQDYYTPWNVFSFSNNEGLCAADEDFGSGGVLVFPDAFYNGLSLVVNADKQSNLYLANTAAGSMGGFNPSANCTGNFNDVQCITTPPIPGNDPGQGYWASPAYWHYRDSQNSDHYMLYYSASTESLSVAPKPLNGYQLQTSGSPGPIASATPTLTTGNVLFCHFSPTPSGSSSTTASGTGIVWAIEHPNKDPQDCLAAQEIPHAALHAFDATTLVELYDSNKPAIDTKVGKFVTFSTPTIFNAHVYIGTQTEVDVFGVQ